MFKKIIALYLLLFFSFNSYAQGWVKVYDVGWGGGNSYRDSSKNFLLYAGGLIVKINNEGELLWVEAPSNYRSNNLYYTFNNEFLLLQTDNSVDPENASVSLLDGNREIKWEYQLNYPHPDNTSHQRTDAMAALQTAEGNYWILGDIEEDVNSSPSMDAHFNYQPFVIELSPEGEKLSFHTYWNTPSALGFSPQKSIAIKESGDGGFVLLTLIDGGGGIQGDFPGFTKINAEGEMEWKQYFSHNLIDIEHEGLVYVTWTFAKNMVITESGEIVIAGISSEKINM
ncbi:MAG: hypothetical protein AB8B69_26715 [Chitinophagales bacterium]